MQTQTKAQLHPDRKSILHLQQHQLQHQISQTQTQCLLPSASANACEVRTAQRMRTPHRRDPLRQQALVLVLVLDQSE